MNRLHTPLTMILGDAYVGYVFQRPQRSVAGSVGQRKGVELSVPLPPQQPRPGIYTQRLVPVTKRESEGIKKPE